MQRLWFTLLAAAGILTATPAGAQDLRTPRLEIGATFSAIVPIVIEDGPAVVAGAGSRVTVNVSRRLAVEGLADILAGLESYGTTALYQTQLKYAVRKAQAGRAVSFTVGAAGLAWYYHGDETRITRPDRSIAVYPGYRQFRVRPPDTFSAGLAREQVFGRHASSYLAIQGYLGAVGGIALRASVGLSFGIGGYR
jgi:hypothetical protein